jgi:uncharacterized membrane protein
MSTVSKPREPLPDILKGIAVLLMIQVHLMELFAREEILNSLTGKISLFLGGPPAAPVFMAVMGFFIAASSKSFKQHVLRGFNLIGLGFLLNIGLNFNLLYQIAAGKIDYNPWPYIFGVDILFLAGLSIIIIAMLKKVFDNRIYLWIAVCLISGAVNQFLPVYSGDPAWIKYLEAYFWGYNWWSYFPLFPWLAYPLLGYIFYHVHQNIRLKENYQRYFVYIAGVALLILIITFNFGFNISTLLSVYYHHSLPYFLWVCVFLILWLIMVNFVFAKPLGRISSYLEWTGKNVTVIYVLQWLIIGNLATEIYKTQHLLQLLFWLIAVVFVSNLLVLGFEKLKLWKIPKG